MTTNAIRRFAAVCFLVCSAVLATAQQYPGYTLIAPQNSTSARLIDTNGTTYKTWNFSSGQTGYSCYLLPNQILLRTVKYNGSAFQGGGQTGIIQKVDWNGNLIWNYQYSTSTYSMHHDVCPMPNGNVLLISYELKTAAEATAAGCTTAITIWSEKIVEIQPVGSTGGNVVWEWHVWDHLCQNANASKANYVSSIVNNPQLFNINRNPQKDWLHMNGIDYNAELDQIVVSSHNWSELFVIDHSTTSAQAAEHSGGNAGKGGDILYRWGNPANYGASGSQIFNVVHDAHWIPSGCPNAGYLAGFNNGGTTSASTVDFVNPPRQGYNYTLNQGSAYEPSTYTYRRLCKGKTTNMGNAQELPNGNLLVCVALAGNIFELNANGDSLWKYAAGSTVPQATRYSAEYVNSGSSTPTVTAGALPQSVCEGSNVQLSATLSSGTGFTYAWTSNPAGFISTEQNPMVTPTQNTTYTVIATNGTITVNSSVAVTIKAKPVVSPIAGKTSAYKNATETYSITPVTGATYLWVVSGGTIAAGKTTATLTVAWGSAEAGNVSITVTGSNGCIAAASQNITLANLTFSVSPSEITLPAAANAKQITVTATAGWTASETADWITLSKTTGTGNDSVGVNVTENTAAAERTALITFSSGAGNQTVKVIQQGKIAVGASADTVYVQPDATGYSVTINSNGTWQASSNQPWLEIDPKTGINVLPVMLKTTKNTGGQRTAVATFTAGDAKDEIVVIQLAAAGSKRKVKFTVDMRNETVNTTGVHVAGDFQEAAGFSGGDWQPNTAPLTREGTTTMYSTVVELPVNAKYEYKFLNGDQFYDSEFVPEASRVGYEFNDNRWFWADSTLGDTIYVGPLVFAGNAPDGKILVRFKVDMKNVTPVAAAGVHVAGTFQDAAHQNDPARTMLYSFGDNAYEIMSYVEPNSTHLFRYYNGNIAASSETVPALCATNSYRSITAISDTVLNAVCFSSCTLCAAAGVEDKPATMSFGVFPNPFTREISVQLPEGAYRISVNDALGRALYSAESLHGNEHIYLPETSGGVYLLRAVNLTTGETRTMTLVHQ